MCDLKGCSMLEHVLKTIKEIDEYQKAQERAAKINLFFCIIKPPLKLRIKFFIRRIIHWLR